MTTPGGQLTPGDEPEIGDPPIYGVPSGAYVGDAGSPQSFKDLNTLTKDKAKRRMQQPLEGMFGRQSNALMIFANTLLGLVQGAVNLVVGTVEAIVGGIGAIIESIGSLFGMSHQDTARVDAARADGERAIVANMSASLEHLDEIQRVGVAYMGVPTFAFDNGEEWSHQIPLTAMIPLNQGVRLIPPAEPLTHGDGHVYDGGTANERNATRERLARGAGQLELTESGLWLIYFQAAVRQGGSYSNRPVDVYCHVTPADSPYLPEGAPGVTSSGITNPGRQEARRRDTGAFAPQDIEDFVVAYGRAGSYVGTRDSNQGGGNTVFGMVVAYLEEGAWKVNMSTQSYRKFEGVASTYVAATKVNSETLRQDIDLLKDAIADSLPGVNVPLDLDEAAIQAMVGQADSLEAPPVQVPPMEAPGD